MGRGVHPDLVCPTGVCVVGVIVIVAQEESPLQFCAHLVYKVFPTVVGVIVIQTDADVWLVAGVEFGDVVESSPFALVPIPNVVIVVAVVLLLGQPRVGHVIAALPVSMPPRASTLKACRSGQDDG